MLHQPSLERTHHLVDVFDHLCKVCLGVRSVVRTRPTLANCCTRVAIVELRKPYLIPQTSATALPRSPCVELASSTTLNRGRRIFRSAGTTAATVLYVSLIEDRFSLDKNPEDGAANVCGSSTSEGCIPGDPGGWAKRCRDRRCNAWARSVVWMVLMRRSELNGQPRRMLSLTCTETSSLLFCPSALFTVDLQILIDMPSHQPWHNFPAPHARSVPRPGADHAYIEAVRFPQ
jgi:hypothetical protein